VSDSGGARPISVTAHRDIVYVLNAGGQVGGVDAIAGFRRDTYGRLSALEGAMQPLSADSTAPAQIEFSPDGRFLVVTEKATGIIDLYTVGNDGLAGEPVSYESPAPTPFGFAFGKRGQLFVSEAAGGAPDGSSVSSYEISRNGALQLISPAVPTTETAACWLVVSADGRFAYTTNGGSASVSGFAIDFDGVISLLDEDGETGQTGETPLDMAFSSNGRYLYTLNVGDGTISAFRFQADGSLLPLREVSGLPGGVNGLAAR
jgi:6-phosphogluconolactonase (cycloisomerase 2 family)